MPTPIAVGDKLFVATENNGSRLYGFGPDGRISPKPVAANPPRRSGPRLASRVMWMTSSPSAGRPGAATQFVEPMPGDALAELRAPHRLRQREHAPPAPIVEPRPAVPSA